jgi:hypothetical protein
MSVVEGDKIGRMALRAAYLHDPAAPIAHPDRPTVHPYPVTKLRLHSCHLHLAGTRLACPKSSLARTGRPWNLWLLATWSAWRRI